MMSLRQQLEMKIGSFAKERAALDRAKEELLSQEKALRAALDALGPTAPKVTAPAAPKKPGFRRDRNWEEHTMEFLVKKGKPVTIATVSRELRITEMAARNRLHRLTNDGRASRLGRGVYQATATLRAK